MLQNFEDYENASSSKAALWLHIGEDLMLKLISRNVPKSVWGRTAPMFVLLVAVFAHVAGVRIRHCAGELPESARILLRRG